MDSRLGFRTFAAAVLCALVLPAMASAFSAVNPQAVLEVDEARVWGNLHGGAGLSGFLHAAQVGDDEPSSVTFEFEAESIDAVTDVREDTPHAAGVQGGGSKSSHPTHHGGASVSLIQPPRAHYELALLPLPGEAPPTLSFEDLACLDLKPSAADTLAPRALVEGGRQMPRQDVSTSLALHSSCHKAIQIRGSFWMSLYEFDIRVREPSRVTDYYTGESRQEEIKNPTSTTSGVGFHDMRQTFLSVYNGSFTLRLAREAPLVLHVADLRLSDVSRTVALGATGVWSTAGQEILVAGDNVDVEGKMVLEGPSAKDGRIDLVIIEGAHTLRSGHQTLSLVASTAPALFGLTDPRAALVLATGAVAAMGAGAWVLRKGHRRNRRSDRIRQANQFFQAAREHRKRGHFLRALYCSTMLQRIDPKNGYGHLLRALVYGDRRLWRWLWQRLAVRNHHRAHNLLKDAKKWDDVAWNAYAAACACSRLRRAPEANWWLEKAVELDPSFMNKARMEADFGPLWHHRDFKESIQQLALAYGTQAATQNV